jgi:hypothetical protein
MTFVALGALAALFLYLALRVARMKRKSLPFVVAYPAFVIIFLGGAVATFVAASQGAVRLGFDGEAPRAIAGIYGATALAALVLWLIARGIIGGRD